MKRSYALALAGACPPTVAAIDTRAKVEDRDKPERTGSAHIMAAGDEIYKKL